MTMPFAFMFFLIVLFLAIAVVGTMRVGHSKENQEGNPDYERKTGRNIKRLTSYYIVATIVGIAAFIAFLMTL